MSELVVRPGKESLKCRQAFFSILLILFFTAFSYGEAQDEILLTVHDREITKDEFLYHFQKSNQQNIGEYLDSFIDFQLKLAQAREERVHYSIGFINELSEYRIQLAAPYLSDQEKEEELVREACDRLRFEVNANHILVKLDPNIGPEDTLKAYTKAIKIRNRILVGESFEQLALAVSDDSTVTKNSGNLGYFTAFQFAYPFESAVYKMKPGELSMPVRSRDGYHIIQLNDKRKHTGEKMNEQEVKKSIYDAKDERAEMIESAFVEKLKNGWNFTENLDALEIIYSLADERVFSGNWSPPADRSFDEILFLIDDKNVYQKDFIEFMTEITAISTHMSIREYIFSLYQQFVSTRLITYENYKLADKYPEFRFQIQEYRDAMLLLAITRQKVWLKAESDSAGLEEFYAENKEKYKWGDRLFASIFTALDERSAKQGAKMASKGFRKGENDIWQLLNQINNEVDGEPLTAEQGTFSRGDHPLVDQIKWKRDFSGILYVEDKYQFVFAHNILEPEYKSMDEAYDALLSDYQSYLMKEWIEELHSTYHVQINQKVLSSVE